jgi:predicted lipoprotein
MKADSMRRCALLVLALCCGAACTKDAAQHDVADAPARRALLRNLSEHVILSSYREFEERAQELRDASAAYAGDASAANLEQAQAAFTRAMLAWQRVELFQVGPAARVANANPGSRGLRDAIYSWPDVRPCVVDHGLVAEVYEDAADFAEQVYPYARGLAAIERLLFDSSVQTACAADDRVVTAEKWQALVDGDLQERRARYAALASEVVAERAGELVRAFRDEFMPELLRAGQGSKLFDVTHEAINAVSNALFYIEFDTKDMKLAGPMGLTMSCMDKTCSTELSYSKLSKEAIGENLEALRDAFHGLPPNGERGEEMWGILDLLRSVGAADLADEFESLLADAQGAVDAMEGSLEDALAAGDPSARRAYEAVQALTVRLKTDFLHRLALSPPEAAAADKD